MIQATCRSPDETGARWDWEIPDPQWRVYRRVLEEVRAAGIPVALGGAFALATYTGDLRNTKDLDLYILPRDREATIEAMTRAGLMDYHDRLPYDRSWIYRGTRDDSLVDAIWAMANLRAYVDRDWLTLGPEVQIGEQRVRALPPEELIWCKLYVLQRERSDWMDVFNLLDALGPRLDWERLVARLGADLPLLTAALTLFGWLAPRRAARIPSSAWSATGARRPEPAPGPDVTGTRADLLDSRPWFRGARSGDRGPC